MKTSIIFPALAFLFALPIMAQDRTTVNAMSSEISDNLDLRAIASIFGDAKNLEDFERRLNDPQIQISNLDLNDDNKVDYLRVIESVEDNTHLIVVQAVLGRDVFQDVATIEVERDRNNNVQVQVVGDVYMYGQNYIYEPVYVTAPIIYTTFWAPRYRPYCSTWYWGYYPTYYYAWTPFPVFRYRHNIGVHINFHNHYNYVNIRRCERAIVMHKPIRANYCERTYPTRSFSYRNTSYANRHELDRTRPIKNLGTRNELAYNNTRGGGKYNDPIKQSTRTETPYANTRSNGSNNEPIKQSTRTNAPYTNTRSRTDEPIKQITRQESNAIGREYNDRTGTKTNNNPVKENYGGSRTRNENSAGYNQPNSGTKSPRSYNGNISRERVSMQATKTETRSARENKAPRSERSSNPTGERGSRR